MSSVTDSGESVATADVPGILKRLVRTVTYTFYEPCHIAICNVLLRHILVDEDSLSLLLKIDKKQLRTMVVGLRSDRLLQFRIVKERYIDNEGNQQLCALTFYYINFHIYLNVIKYKMEAIKRKIVSSEDTSRLRPSYSCSNCGRGFTDLDMSRLISNMKTGEMVCCFCQQPVNEDKQSKQQAMSRTLLAKFNQQFSYLHKLVDKCCALEYDDRLLEPQLSKLHIDRAIVARTRCGSQLFDVVELFEVHSNSNDARARRLLTAQQTYSQQLSVSFSDHNGGAVTADGRHVDESSTLKKPLPDWLQTSTITVDTDLNNKKHNYKNKASESVNIVSNAPQQDAEYVENLLMAAEMQDDKATDQPTLSSIATNLDSDSQTMALSDAFLMVDGERVHFDDVTKQMIDKMSEQELEKYTQILNKLELNLL